MPYVLTTICSICKREINSREISKEAFDMLAAKAVKDVWNMGEHESFIWIYRSTEIIQYLPCIDCNFRAENN